mmetsp:Transcript_11905/g.24073  ORF Transcript_11905/g.24073 Transcript_11905/m.24073 type:complete len:361 (-) Transcript_11905:107-1189(-)
MPEACTITVAAPTVRRGEDKSLAISTCHLPIDVGPRLKGLAVDGRRGARHCHPAAADVPLLDTLPGHAALACQAQGSLLASVVLVPDVVGRPVGARAGTSPRADTGHPPVLVLRGQVPRRCTSHDHPRALGFFDPFALASDAAYTPKALGSGGAAIVAIAHVVLLSVRAGAHTAPRAIPARLSIVVFLRRFLWRGSTCHRHPKAVVPHYALAQARDAALASDAAADVEVVPDLVALAIRASAPTTPSADTLNLPIVILIGQRGRRRCGCRCFGSRCRRIRPCRRRCFGRRSRGLCLGRGRVCYSCGRLRRCRRCRRGLLGQQAELSNDQRVVRWLAICRHTPESSAAAGENVIDTPIILL